MDSCQEINLLKGAKMLLKSQLAQLFWMNYLAVAYRLWLLLKLLDSLEQEKLN
jgi:hypothetical protein